VFDLPELNNSEASDLFIGLYRASVIGKCLGLRALHLKLIFFFCF
jgi:hypothetical protein